MSKGKHRVKRLTSQLEQMQSKANLLKVDLDHFIKNDVLDTSGKCFAALDLEGNTPQIQAAHANAKSFLGKMETVLPPLTLASMELEAAYMHLLEALDRIRD